MQLDNDQHFKSVQFPHVIAGITHHAFTKVRAFSEQTLSKMVFHQVSSKCHQRIDTGVAHNINIGYASFL